MANLLWKPYKFWPKFHKKSCSSIYRYKFHWVWVLHSSLALCWSKDSGLIENHIKQISTSEFDLWLFGLKLGLVLNVWIEKANHFVTSKRTPERSYSTIQEGKKLHCSYGNTEFTQRGNLKLQIASIHNVKTFSCMYCSAKFNHKRNIKVHKASIHVGKTIQSMYCNADSTRKGELNEHTESSNKGNVFM